MPDTRWTYVPPTEQGNYGDIALGDFRLWHWLSDHAPIPGGLPDELCYENWAALVAAVRDVDTLRQAREFASKIRPFVNLPGRVDHIALDVLLDLLSSPAPQGEKQWPDQDEPWWDCMCGRFPGKHLRSRCSPAPDEEGTG